MVPLTTKAIFTGEYWRKEEYFLGWDGNYTCFDGDDHDHVEEDEVPSFEDQLDSWEKYRQFVHESGEDPLEEYFVNRTFKRKACYEVELRNSIAGPCVIKWRRGRKPWLPPAKMPMHLASYICMTRYQDVSCEEILNKEGHLIDGQERQDDGSWKHTFFGFENFLMLCQKDDNVEFHGRKPSYGGCTWPGCAVVLKVRVMETVDRTPGAIAQELRFLAKET